MAALAALVLVAACSSAATPAPTAAPTAAPTEAPKTGVSDKAKEVTLSWGTFKLAQRIIDKAAKGEKLNLVVSNQGTAIPVFGAEQLIGVNRGCEVSGDRGLAISCRLAGPALTDMTAQLSELETLLGSDQVDCLGLGSIKPDTYVDIVNKYIAAGIPVFTQNTDVPNSNRIAFFALNERDAGRANGIATANLVKKLGLKIDTIAGGSGGPEQDWAQQRYGGFIEGYKSVIPDAKFYNDEKSLLPSGAPDYTVQQVLEQTGPFLKANPNVNLFFHTDQGVEGVGQVIKDQGHSGKVWASGFNVSFAILDSLDAGDTLVTINQGFDNQSEAAIEACVDFLADGTYPPDPMAYLDPIIVTKDGGEGMENTTDQRAHLTEILGK